MQRQSRTSRVRRTWAEKLLRWPHAYETEISYGHRKVIGRGSTPEASIEAAERRMIQDRKRELGVQDRIDELG